jgi:hypothetical protein
MGNALYPSSPQRGNVADWPHPSLDRKIMPGAVAPASAGTGWSGRHLKLTHWPPRHEQTPPTRSSPRDV